MMLAIVEDSNSPLFFKTSGRGLIGVCIIILMLTLLNTASAQQTRLTDTAEDFWPLSRHDSGRTGYNPTADLTPPISLYAITDDVVFGSGSEYELTIDELGFYLKGRGDLVAYNAVDLNLEGEGPFTTTERWRLSDWPIEDWFIEKNSGAIEGERIIINALYQDPVTFEPSTILTVRDRMTGHEQWRKVMQGVYFSEFTVSDGKIWLLWRDTSVNPEKGRLAAYDVVSGNEVIAPLETSEVFGSPSLTVANGRLFRVNGASSPGEIVAHSLDTGAELWRYPDLGDNSTVNQGLVAIADAVIVNFQNRIFVLNAADGSLRWEKDASVGIDSCGFFSETFVSTDGKYVALTGVCDDYIIVYDIVTGEEKWRKSLGNTINYSNKVIAGEVIYVFSAPSLNWYVLAYNFSDGTELFSFEQDSKVGFINAFAAANGLLYVSQIKGSGYNSVAMYEREPADLSVSIAGSGGASCGGAVGGTLRYEVEVMNNGPGPSSSAQITITADGDIQNVITPIENCMGASPLSCNVGPLEAGESATVILEVSPTYEGSHVTKVAIGGEVRDLNTSDNFAFDEVDVTATPSPAFDLAVMGIEVIQVTQNLNNDIPLVSQKPTVVRVIVQTNEDVENVQAVLRGFRGSDELTASPLSPITDCIDLFATGPDRSQLTGTFNFLLPQGWNTGELTLTTEVNRGPAIPEADLTNNLDAEVVIFEELPPICIVSYPVETGDASNNTLIPDSKIPDTIIDRAVSLLPTRQIRNYPKRSTLAEWGFGNYELPGDGWGIITKLWFRDQFSDDPDRCDEQDARTLYLGVVDPATPTFNGLGRRPGDQLIVRMETGSANAQPYNDPLGGRTLAHEIGHNYNRKHVGCGNCGQFPTGTDNDYPYNSCVFSPGGANGFFGLDLFTIPPVNVIAPNTGSNSTGDLMTYNCNRWPSDYTYLAFYDKLVCQTKPLCISPSSIDNLAGTKIGKNLLESSEVLLLGGRITSTTAEIDSMYRVPQEQVPLAKLDRLQQVRMRNTLTLSDYVLELVDNGDSVLHSEPFEPEQIPDDPADNMLFTVSAPFTSPTAKILIKYQGSTISTTPVSANAPTVNITKPTAGNNITNILTIQWTADDLDGDDLNYTIQYSNNGGLTWEVLVVGFLETRYDMDADLLAGSDGMSLVRVIANDGVNTGSDESDLFNVKVHPPLVSIDQPEEDETFSLGDLIVLRASETYDPEDGLLEGDAVRWSIDGMGEVGLGREVYLEDLQPGPHIITLEATDSDTQTGSDMVTIYVESYVAGDVVQDGLVNQTDINAIIDHILERVVLDGASFQNADYNSDAMIDSGDVIALIGLLY